MTAPQAASIVTTPRDSGLGTADGDAFDAIKADLNQLWLTPGQVLFSASGLTPLVYSGSGISGPSNSWLYLDAGNLTGTASNANTPGIISPVNFNIGHDAVDTTTLGNGNLIHYSFRSAASTNHTGGREALQGYLNVVGTPAIPPGTGGYVGVQGLCRVTANLTGSGSSYLTYRGGIFAKNAYVQAQSGATFLSGVASEEFDVSVATGASCANKWGITIVLAGADAVRGAFDDAAIGIGIQQNISNTWKNGLQFGAYGGAWPFGADSTLIFAQQRQIGPVSNSIALYGVDFRNCTFQTGGAAFISTGFQVDPTGQVVPQVATVSTLPTGILGGRAFVTDATQTMTAGIGAVVAGGGGNKVPVYWDGTNWRIGG